MKVAGPLPEQRRIKYTSSGHSIREGMPDALKRQLDKRIGDAISGETSNTIAKGIMKSQSFWMVSTDMVADVFPAEIEMGDNSRVSTTELFSSSFMRQDPARFFLVSPCSADLKVRKAMRACNKIGADYDDAAGFINDSEKHFEYYTDPSDTSSRVEMSKITVPEEKTISPGGYVSEDFEAAKFCVTGYTDDWFFKKTQYHDSIPAIQIDPKILSDEKNFCYAGSHIWQDSMETVVTIISIAISIGTSGAGAVLAGPVAVIINHQISQTEYWPNH